jgi:hypothetical protein
MSEDTIQATEQSRLRRQGRLVFYHPNSKGSGCALQLDMRLNAGEERRYDCFFLSMARQKNVATKTDGREVPASFDWESRLTAKLGFLDVCEIITVLEGRRPAVGNGRGGLFHASGDGNTVIDFRRSEEPAGYSVALSRKANGSAQPVRMQLLLGEAEAAGLRCILHQGLFFLTFRA